MPAATSSSPVRTCAGMRAFPAPSGRGVAGTLASPEGRMGARRGIGRAIDKGIFWAFMVLVVVAPVPLGSNRSWAWSLLECGIFALVAAWLLLWALGAARMPQPLLRSWPVFAALGVWIVHTAIHGLADAAVGPQATMTLSLEPYASRTAL